MNSEGSTKHQLQFIIEWHKSLSQKHNKQIRVEKLIRSNERIQKRTKTRIENRMKSRIN